MTGDDGGIYLWLTKIDDLSSTPEPRSYKLPYSDPLHEKIIRVKAKLDKNILQLGEFKDPEDEAILENIEEKRSGQISQRLEFYDLPDPLFPEK